MGYDVNTGEMVAAAGSIRSYADPLRDKHSKQVADIGFGEANFGRVHGQHFSGYQDGMNKLSKCIASMTDAMDGFAQKLEQSGSGYDWTEASNADMIGQTGGD